MAIFVPRVFEEIQGENVANILAVTPLTDVNFGSVWTTMLEAAAQEDDEQYFQMLEIIRGFSLDTTTGEDLDNRAFEFGLERLDAAVATSIVTLGDTALQKVSTNVFSGEPGSAAGTSSINGDNSTGFPTTGSIIVGRGTPNVETVAYTSITNNVNFVTFNLSGAFANDHGTDETIILSQIGDRVIVAGTVVLVPASDINPQIEFTLDAVATILDGEEIVENVSVSASAAGAASNVPIGSIIEFDSLPFSTATVTNPNRVTNGRDEETDQELRDRIKETIQSLSRGTPTAVSTGVLNVISETDNKRVVSSSLIEPTTPSEVVKLFIDDGTGFIPTFANIGFETVVALATGGEKFLDILNVPVLKAFAETEVDEPYNLVGGETLFVSVGGQVETILFDSTDFSAPGAATAQEVLTKINLTAELFESRVSSGGTKVRIFARANIDEEIEVTGGTANLILLFPTDSKFTTKLYRERDFGITLLSKDGKTASIESGNTVTYDLSDGTNNLTVVVDGKPSPLTVWFEPSDFVDASLVVAEAVCDLIDAQIPGLSCSPSSNDTKFSLFSNTKRSSNSKLRTAHTFDAVLNEEAGVDTDRTAEFKSAASDVTIFGADLDFVHLGHLQYPFETIFVDLDTVASADISPTFEYFNGTIFTPMGVLDRTLGFTQNGHIVFGPLPDWEKTTVGGLGPAFFIRIQRNNAAAITAPIENTIKINNANDKFGFSEVEVIGEDKDYSLNRFLGQIELVSPLQADDVVTLGSSKTRAFVVTAANGNYGLFGGEVFDIVIDGVAQSYTFLVGDFFTPGSALPSEVVTALQANLDGVKIETVDSGLKVQITSNKYNGGTLNVTTSTANAILQFPEGEVTSLISHFPSLESGSAEPYTFAISTSIIVIIDENFANNFTVPLSHLGTLTAGISAVEVEDTSLSATFPLASDLIGYEIEITSGAQIGERKIITAYTPGTGRVVVGVAFSGTPAALDTYEILPVTAEDVVNFFNNTSFTLLSIDADIATSSGGTNVQITSKLSGETASVQVSGGTANAVLGFPVLTEFGVDGYKYFTNLAQLAQFTVDGREDNQEEFPGIRAAGVQIEVIEPVKKPQRVELNVTANSGITLISISNDIKTAVSSYINTLGVGDDVIRSDITCDVKEVDGVFDVDTIEPAANVAIADNELARISDEDIIVG